MSLRLPLVLVVLVALALALAPGQPAAAGRATADQRGRCGGALPVAMRLPTRTARALERLGFVRVIAGTRVRDVHVMLTRGGRMVAHGSRSRAFTGAAAVRLAFARSARPGAVSLVVTGRRAGCAAKRSARRAIALDSNDLPVALAAADRDVSDGSFAVRLRPTGSRSVSDLRLRVLDARGATIAEHARDAPLGEPLLIELTPSERPPAGRYAVLVTAAVRGERPRGAVAATIVLDPGSPPARADGDPPPAGVVVAQASVSWSGGRWHGADSASFSIPAIGDGQLVCRPDTQWLRVFPSDRSRDVAMLLWTARDWEGGSEVAIREAQMTPFTGPDFNEGMNKFTPPEHRSHGTFTGIVGDGLPPAGTFGAGRMPTEVRVSWSWDFDDPAGARCSVVATLSSQGEGSAGAVARGLSLAWRGESGVPADTTLTTPVPGFGTVRLRCDPRPEGVRRLVVEPDAAPAGLVLTTFEGSDRSDRVLGAAPFVLALPNNGLIEAATPSGAPFRLMLASRWKVNDPDPAENFCRLSGLAVGG